MAELKGTNNNSNVESINEFFDNAAVCDDDSFQELFDESTDESTISNLIDDSENVVQGNSLALLNAQLSEEYDKDLVTVKRKFYATPEKLASDLSPRLSAVHITPERQSKRRLFRDSGIEDEAENSIVQVQDDSSNVAGNKNGADAELYSLLHSNNRRAALLCKFKEKYGIPFNEITRTFKSNKSCTQNWIIVVFACAEDLIEASKTTMQNHVSYLQMITSDFSALYIICFKAAKSRETVVKLINSLLNTKEEQVLCDPPKIKSMAAALYCYKKVIADTCYKYGDFPDWIATHTVINHQLATADTFKFSDMVQWAYDNDMLDEAAIAYNYACYASENANAAAFLQTNSQLKYVKECCAMVRLYKKQEMRNMTMSEWIKSCFTNNYNSDDWKVIVRYLKYQNINFLEFLLALKLLLKGIPKKMCLVIYGPPDTGKSYFCYQFIQFMRGKVVSFMNKNSHFWLMPLLDSKIGFLDDATQCCWMYLDTHMRNAFDGNAVSVDVKHKNLQQIVLPPMLITTNCDVCRDPTFMYLRSRLTCFNFPNKLPLYENGEPKFKFNDNCWTSFFSKFWKHLDLPEDDPDGDTGNSERTFSCTTRHSIESD